MGGQGDVRVDREAPSGKQQKPIGPNMVRLTLGRPNPSLEDLPFVVPRLGYEAAVGIDVPGGDALLCEVRRVDGAVRGVLEGQGYFAQSLNTQGAPTVRALRPPPSVLGLLPPPPFSLGPFRRHMATRQTVVAAALVMEPLSPGHATVPKRPPNYLPHEARPGLPAQTAVDQRQPGMRDFNDQAESWLGHGLAGEKEVPAVCHGGQAIVAE
jgi:hypothetical protein